MATVNRPPFYVPRPADDTYWLGTPVGAPVLEFLTKQKFFGAGGQAPTKSWAPIYTYDDSSVWYASPVSSTILEFLTKQKMFGAGGQVPAKLWRYDWDVGETFWYASPLASNLLHPLLTAVGQVKPRPTPRLDTVDDAFWLGSPISSKYIPQVLTIKSRQWVFGIDDSAVWSGSPLHSSTVPFFTVGGKPPTPHWQYNFDDSALWQLTIQRDAPLLSVTAAPFTSRQPVITYDDSSSWQWQPPYAIVLSLAPYRTPNLYYNNVVDDPAWQWVPHVAFAPPSITPFVNRYQFNYDDPAIWQYTYQRNIIPSTTPFFSKQWIYTNDDPGVWQWQPPYAITLQLAVYRTPNLYPLATLDEPSVWWGWSNRNLAASTPSSSPLINYTWRFNNDDAAVWSGTPQNSATVPFFTVGGKPPTPRWAYNLDDPAVLPPPVQRNNALFAPPQVPFVPVQWRFGPTNNDDSSVWWQWTTKNVVLTFTPPTPSPELHDKPFFANVGKLMGT